MYSSDFNKLAGQPSVLGHFQFRTRAPDLEISFHDLQGPTHLPN